MKAYANSPYGQIHYVYKGEGPAIVLIAPSKRSSRVHSDLIDLLAKSYCVVSPDNLGYGNSDPLPDQVTIDMLGETVMCCLDELGIRQAYFYGLHTGNKIAASIATRWPERVLKLVLAGHSHSLIPDQDHRNAVIGDLVKDFLKTDTESDSERRALNAWASLYRRIAEVWWESGVFSAGATTDQIALRKRIVLDYLQSVDSTVGLYQANFSYDLGAAMKQISAPTMILEIATPAEDQEYGRQGEIVQKLISGSILHTLHEPLGHTHTLETRAKDLDKILGDFFR